MSFKEQEVKFWWCPIYHLRTYAFCFERYRRHLSKIKQFPLWLKKTFYDLSFVFRSHPFWVSFYIRCVGGVGVGWGGGGCAWGVWWHWNTDPPPTSSRCGLARPFVQEGHETRLSPSPWQPGTSGDVTFTGLVTGDIIGCWPFPHHTSVPPGTGDKVLRVLHRRASEICVAPSSSVSWPRPGSRDSGGFSLVSPSLDLV